MFVLLVDSFIFTKLYVKIKRFPPAQKKSTKYPQTGKLHVFYA